MDEFIGGLGSKVVELSQDKWMKLAISILIDIIGILTFLIPVVRQRVFLRACACGRVRACAHLYMHIYVCVCVHACACACGASTSASASVREQTSQG
jgi:hypothetical protein